MAQPTTLKWNRMAVFLGDGSSPQNFVNPCGLTQREFGLDKALADSVIPDCDDLDAVPWTGRTVRSLSGNFTGSGVMATESYDDWREFALSDDSRDVRIVKNTLGYWQGKMHLARLRETGNEGDGYVNLSVELSSDGELTWHPGT